MQAERDAGQLMPETSIRAGARKLRQFRDSATRSLRTRGIDPQGLSPEEVARVTMVAYNAGPGTLGRALQYAAEAGDARGWFEPDHFLRALIYYGAFNERVALASCLSGASAVTIVAELAALARIGPAEFRARYRGTRGWQTTNIWSAVGSSLREAKARFKGTNLSMAQLRQQAPRWLTCSVEFKHNNLERWYLDRVIAYMRYYQSR